ncbi:MAG: GNAT family N-acetyltransferase [Bryobacteraceae bacterium]
MTIRAATAADLEEIAAIQGASPQAAHWAPADHLNYDCLVAVVAGRVHGFLTARETAPGEREILNLAVAPEQRRRGIARGLLQDELARARGSWYLEVRESNIAALGLYISAGFEISGRRKEYYNDPTETGVVMRFFS